MGIYGSKIINERYILLSEAYIGKTETLLEIEKQIGIIRANVKRYTDINRSKEVQQLNRLFEKQFGMEIFSLHVEQNNTINAYTVPVACNFDISFKDNIAKKVAGNKENGFYFKEKNGLCIICNIYLGLLSCEEITDGEILAVILHELGHNFADAISKTIRVANEEFVVFRLQYLIYTAILSLGIKAIPNYINYRNNTNKVKKKQESKTRNRRLKGLVDGIKARFSDMSMYVDEIISRLCGTGSIIYYKSITTEEELKQIKKSADRQNEVIADRFAGIYGYGPEQASALIKMHKQVSKAEKFVDKLGGFGKIINRKYNDAFKDIYKYDCHPHVIQRLNEELKLLNEELSKSDLDPRLVKVMKQQVKELEKLRDEVTTVDKKLPKSEQERALFYQQVAELDPDAVDDEIAKKIAEDFDKIMEV